MYSSMTEQRLAHISRVALETASAIGIPLGNSSMMVFVAKTASVKTSGVKRAALSIALRESRRCRAERQRDRDNDAKFGGHRPSPLFALVLKRLAGIGAYSSLSRNLGTHHTFPKYL
jgi:hypothetical protein